MAFVLGATGQQGSATVEALLRRGVKPVYGLTRDVESKAAKELAAKGCTMLAGSLEDADAMEKLFKATKATTLFAVTTFLVNGKIIHGAEIKQGTAIAEAVKRTVGQWQLIVLCTMSGTTLGKTGVMHNDDKIDVLNALKGTGAPVAELRPGVFMDNYISIPDLQIKKEGTITSMLQAHKKAQYVYSKDTGEFAAIMMTNPKAWAGKGLEVAGDDLTAQELADTLGRLRGSAKPWKVFVVPRFILRLMAPEFARMLDVQERPAGQNGFVADIPALRKMHPGLRTWEAFVKEVGLDKKELAKPRFCSIM